MAAVMGRTNFTDPNTATRRHHLPPITHILCLIKSTVYVSINKDLPFSAWRLQVPKDVCSKRMAQTSDAKDHRDAWWRGGAALAECIVAGQGRCHKHTAHREHDVYLFFSTGYGYSADQQA